MPTWSNSLFSGPSVALVAFICSTRSRVTTLTTNCSVSRTFRGVSFKSLLPTGANMTTGGSTATTLKKLYGARLSTPASLVVLIQPMGRGVTVVDSRR